MKKLPLVLILFASLGINAQTKKPAEKKSTVTIIDHGDFGVDEVENKKAEYEVYDSNPSLNFIIAKSGRRYALVDYTTKKQLTRFIFEEVGDINKSNLLPVTMNLKKGMIDTKGRMVIPCVYDNLDEITAAEQTRYIAERNGRQGVLSERNEVLIPFHYSAITPLSKNNPHLVVKQNKRSGLLNTITNKMILPVQYGSIYYIKDGIAQVYKDKRYGLFNTNTQLLFATGYWRMDVYNFQHCIVQLGLKKGLIDITGKVIIPVEYDELTASPGKDRSVIFFIGKKQEKYGAMSHTGQILRPFEYDDLHSPTEEIVMATKNGKVGLLPLAGSNEPLAYDFLMHKAYYYLAKANDKYGILTLQGVMALPAEYENVYRIKVDSLPAGTFVFMGVRNGKKGIVDITNKTMVDFIYDDLIPVETDHSSGPESLEKFNNCIIAVKDGRYGMIDRHGKTLLPFVYDELQYLNQQLVIAAKKNKYGIVDIFHPDITVLPFNYSFISISYNDVIAWNNGYERYRVKDDKLTPVKE